MHVGGLHSAGGDADCAGGVLEREVLKRTHERGLPTSPLAHHDELGALPGNASFRFEELGPFALRMRRRFGVL